MTLPHLSSAANAADPGDVSTVGEEIERRVFFGSLLCAHLGGPHLRAMTISAYTSNSHHTGTWSDGFSRPRTFLSMPQPFR